MSLKSISHKGIYYNPREVVETVVKPALKHSKKLSIIAGYFTIESLLEVAEGLEVFLNSSGKINLIIGVPQSGLDELNAGLISAIKIAEESEGNKDYFLEFENLLISSTETLESELQKDKIRVVAYLLKNKLLNVKFAFKKAGMVHAKVYIFEDEVEDYLVVNGSMNPTRQGFIDNTEVNSIDTSWQTPLNVETHKKMHDMLWNNRFPDHEVVSASSELGEKLLKVVGEKDIYSIIENLSNSGTLKDFYLDLINSPVWLEYTLSHSSLYPHQTNAVQECVSSWPMRNLFADEVGLGKTIEVGACIAYAVKHLGVKRILILTPASVVHQWQAELKLHFGLNNFFVKSQKNKKFVDIEGNEVDIDNQNIYTSDFPEFCILSKDFATKHNFQNIFSDSNFFPEMLVVDEAHHARGYKNTSGKFESTQFRQMLDSIKSEVQHIIFASATPMRKSYLEYYYLLQLLGIDELLDESDYDFTLIDLGRTIDKIDSFVFGRIFKILLKTVDALNSPPFFLSANEKNLFNKIKRNELNESNLIENLDLDKDILSLLIRIHPTSLFTTRHFRDSLGQYDTYSFPERIFSTEEILEEDVSDSLNELFVKLVHYAENYYLKPEELFGKFISRRLGVASFKEAFVSSYAAAKSRLQNRKEKLEEEYIKKLTTQPNKDEEIKFVICEDFDTDDEIEFEIDDLTGIDTSVIVDKAKKEVREIRELLEICSAIDNEVYDVSPDPKMNKLIELLKLHFKTGTPNTKPVLVFSKFLSTLDEAIKLTEEHILPNINGIGMYKGGGKVEVRYSGLEWRKSNREEIKDDLDEQSIDIVFCSSAAQEGVNLQAAATLINLDVPWIPSDLEQRIGRIARLGQKESAVTIFNLWYPNSYEAKIYKRLLQRKDLLEVALGKYPDIVSDAIKNQTFGSSDIIGIDEIIDRLSDLKNEVSTIALSKLWNSNSSVIEPFSNLFRRKLIDNFSYFDNSINNMTEVPGEKNSISLRKIKISSIFQDYKVNLDNKYRIFSLNSNNLLVGMAIEKENKIKIINPYYLSDVVKGLLTTEKINLDYLDDFDNQSGYEILKNYKNTLSEWLIPLHDEFTKFDNNIPFKDLATVEKQFLGTINLDSE